MPVMNPAPGTGTRSRPADMTYVDPARLMLDADREAFLAGTGLNGPFVADLLSDMLAHERCGRRLYTSATRRTHNPLLKQRYERYGDQTAEHAQILEELIIRLGGDPSYVSPAARATETAGTRLLESTFLLAGSIDLLTQEIVILNAVLLAEALDHANWTCLGELTRRMPDGEVKEAVVQVVDRVEDQEDEHLRWAEDTRCLLVTTLASSKAMAKATAKVEEAIDRISSLFAEPTA